MIKKISIIGRPNVGKSTLFNRICGKKSAIVHDFPGVTRDVKNIPVKIMGVDFQLLDTAGLEQVKDVNSISGKMTDKTINAIKESDIVIFLTDLSNTDTGLDQPFAKILKKENKRVILVGNKSDIKGSVHNQFDLFKLGFGEPIVISAEHGIGVVNLYEEILNVSKQIDDEIKIDENDNNIVDEISDLIESNNSDDKNNIVDNKIRLSIIGRPNVGKSTLINALIHDDKMIVSDIAGTTRDSIDSEFIYNDKEIIITDTAGVRRKSKIDESLEELSVKQTFNSIRKSNITVLVIDGTVGIDKQDLVLIDYANSVGNGIIVLINKADKIADKKEVEEEVSFKIQNSFNQIKNISIITISALKKTGLKKLLDKVLEVHSNWQIKISTGQLNRWLERAVIKNPPPLSRLKRPMKFKYITQTGVCPPEFTIFTGGASDAPDSYQKYLINSIRDEFKIFGVPIRIKFKKSDNPFSNKDL